MWDTILTWRVLVWDQIVQFKFGLRLNFNGIGPKYSLNYGPKYGLSPKFGFGPD